MSEKPEWFELAGEDRAPELPVAKSKKRLLKLAAFTAPLVLVGGAMVFADGHEEEERPNINTTIPSVASNTTTTSTTTSNNAGASKSISAQQSSEKSPSPISPNSPKAIPSKGPGIQAPGGNGDDDHEGFGGEREHEGREGGHHERGEHEGRGGTAPTIPKTGTTTKN